ncbi:MAG TPA: hypothetical protein VFQ82_10650 [Stellaceae bacterium]|nr:hypothetical protein [Stellaceae bacterium]
MLEMSGWRKLRKEEADLIVAIVRDSPRAEQVVRSLPRQRVKDMPDGGMGSLRFKAADDRVQRFGKEIGEVLFTDQDGVMVSATVNIDDYGELFELDIWKTDSSPLQRYPQPDEVRRPTVGR